jgi:lipoprotein-anchoring transpeptidase ErfK/SrfK
VRSPSAAAVVAALAVLLGGALAVLAYDRSRETTIAEGIQVGGIDLGGLERPAAAAKLRDELLRPLSRSVIVRSRGERFTLTAKVAHVAADVDAMADEALRRSRQGNPLARTLRAISGGEVRADIEPDVRYSSRAVANLVRRVARTVERPARDADVRYAQGGIDRVESREGLRLQRERLRDQVEQALTQPAENQRIVTAKVRRVKPRVTTGELARKHRTIVHIDRGGFTLRLYKDLELVKTYPIAVGQVGLETPAGLYDIQNKAVNPAWNVPNSAWAGSLAGTVVPGGVPENPLKARWLGIYGGAGIHGTDARGSIGTNASHGCIRMLVEDVVELYDRVPVGAPVYIA